MYCDYWNLKKAPFDNVPDPTMYAACHTSMENVISETLFAIKEANESIAVIISEAGLGKTLSLHVINEALDSDQYRSVFITNPSLSFPQLLREIIVLLTEKPCEEIQKGALLDVLKQHLSASIHQDRKVVILIDEASTLSPANLEDLRLLTNMQDDRQNLLTLVLAGNLELARRLEHPDQANLFQRIGAYGRIDKLSSPEAVNKYIESRLKMAGTHIRIFSDECLQAIWEYSDHGVPRLINKICKLCLKAGETNQFDYISEDMVVQVASRFRKLSETTIQITPPHIPSSTTQDLDLSASVVQTDNSSQNAIFLEADAALAIPQAETGILIPFPNAVVNEYRSNPLLSDNTDIAIETSEDEDVPVLKAADLPQENYSLSQPINDVVDAESFQGTQTSPDIKSEWIPEALKTETIIFDEETKTEQPVPDETKPDIVSTEIPVSEIPILIEASTASLEAENGMNTDGLNPDAQISNKTTIEPQIEDQSWSGENTQYTADESHAEQDVPSPRAEETDGDIILIGDYRVQLSIPKDILKQVKSFNRESANKSAGFWAAQIIKNNPQLTRSGQSDPVHIWNEIKDTILKKIAL